MSGGIRISEGREQLVRVDCPCVNSRCKTVDGIARLGQRQSPAPRRAPGPGWSCFDLLGFFLQHVKIYIFKDRFNLDICFLCTRCCWLGLHYSILH